MDNAPLLVARAALTHLRLAWRRRHVAYDRTVGVARNWSYGWRHRKDASLYCMIPGYRHRIQESYFDDTIHTDEWQKEVYQYAAARMRSEGMQFVHDIGCGSGYKLVHYLGQYKTIGYDLEPTVSFLKSTYADRVWRVAGSAVPKDEPVELVICADVIEHVRDPDDLLIFLSALGARYVIISTPDRDLLYAKGRSERYGPPANPSHMREWNRREFRRYIGETFDIIEHTVTNRVQGTQMVLCKPRNSQRF